MNRIKKLLYNEKLYKSFYLKKFINLHIVHAFWVQQRKFSTQNSEFRILFCGLQHLLQHGLQQGL